MPWPPLCAGARRLFVPDATPLPLGLLLLYSLCAGAAFLSLMIPTRIRFTGDQGRIILYTVYEVIALCGVALARLLPGQKEQAAGFIRENAVTLLPVLAVCAAAVLLALGYALAARWIRKKEF